MSHGKNKDMKLSSDFYDKLIKEGCTPDLSLFEGLIRVGTHQLDKDLKQGVLTYIGIMELYIYLNADHPGVLKIKDCQKIAKGITEFSKLIHEKKALGN